MFLLLPARLRGRTHFPFTTLFRSAGETSLDLFQRDRRRQDDAAGIGGAGQFGDDDERTGTANASRIVLAAPIDRKSTRLNSSHRSTPYADRRRDTKRSPPAAPGSR